MEPDGAGIRCDQASPEGYELVGECLGGRLIHMVLKKGEKDQPHDHPAHVIYVIKGGTLKITGPAGETRELLDGAGACMPAGAHQVENVGANGMDVDLLLFEPSEQAGKMPEGHFPLQKSVGDNSKTLAENEACMVMETTLKAGEEDRPHSYRDHLMYVLEGEQLTIHPGQGKVAEPMVVDVMPGAVLPLPSGFNLVQNTGCQDVKVVSFKSRISAPSGQE
eukprot:TRINITY_DN6856_c0_g2_i1.p1 TRINITY_DN6856_c0_g2~~TRINITY_DN6856_c0_g2_i1.p1  ORF type:complete len:221 (-),score=51.18 TRINITY_DN6856_c0_g2_i1:46-708(-)